MRREGRGVAAAALVLVGALAAVAQDAAAPKGEREIVVVDEEGRPVPGVGVRITDGGFLNATTDRTGRVAVPADLGDGPLGIDLTGAGAVREARLVGRRLVVTARGLPELRVTAHDARTGEPVTPVGVTAGFWKVVVPLDAADDGAFVAPRIAADAEGEFSFDVHVAAPEGYADAVVAPGGAVSAIPGSHETLWSRHATTLVVDVPLWPEGFARIRAVDADGAPVAGAEVERIAAGSIDDRGWAARRFRNGEEAVATGDDGVLALRNLPRIPGETWQVRIAHAVEGGEIRRGLVSVEPAGSPPREAVDVPLRAPTDGGMTWGRGGPARAPAEKPIEPHPVASERGSIEVTATLADDRPAAHSLVRVDRREGEGWTFLGSRRTDAEGRVLLEELPPGRISCALAETGVVWAARGIDLEPGGSATCWLEEPVGRNVIVRVRTPGGASAPGAAVRLLGTNPTGPLVLREGTTQRFATFTDERGTAVLRAAPGYGGIVVFAQRGSRRGQAAVDPRVATVTVDLE